MRNGMYHVTFNTPMGSGQGVVALIDGAVNGGDDGYLYQGKFESLGGDAAKATLLVKRYNPTATSVFGDLQSFALDLSGSFSPDGFTVTGRATGMPVTISIKGRWIAEVVV